jgi:hypothetical protein
VQLNKVTNFKGGNNLKEEFLLFEWDENGIDYRDESGAIKEAVNHKRMEIVNRNDIVGACLDGTIGYGVHIIIHDERLNSYHTITKVFDKEEQACYYLINLHAKLNSYWIY